MNGRGIMTVISHEIFHKAAFKAQSVFHFHVMLQSLWFFLFSIDSLTVCEGNELFATIQVLPFKLFLLCGKSPGDDLHCVLCVCVTANNWLTLWWTNGNDEKCFLLQIFEVEKENCSVIAIDDLTPLNRMFWLQENFTKCRGSFFQLFYLLLKQNQYELCFH